MELFCIYPKSLALGCVNDWFVALQRPIWFCKTDNPEWPFIVYMLFILCYIVYLLFYRGVEGQTASICVYRSRREPVWGYTYTHP